MGNVTSLHLGDNTYLKARSLEKSLYDNVIHLYAASQERYPITIIFYVNRFALLGMKLLGIRVP